MSLLGGPFGKSLKPEFTWKPTFLEKLKPFLWARRGCWHPLTVWGTGGAGRGRVILWKLAMLPGYWGSAECR